MVKQPGDECEFPLRRGQRCKCPVFVRLTIADLHDQSGQQIGIFHAMRYLRDDGDLSDREESVANEVFDWLFDHLDAPHDHVLEENPTAVSWFRAAATEHLAQAERLIPILEAHAFQVIRAESVDPGEVIYEDAVQVFAMPRVPKNR